MPLWTPWTRRHANRRRQDDYVVLKSGVRLGRLDRIVFGFQNIREAQIRQAVIGEIQVLVQPGAGYTKEDENLLRAAIKKTIHDDSKVTIDYVDEIERTASGKLRFVCLRSRRKTSSGTRCFRRRRCRRSKVRGQPLATARERD